MKRRAITRLIVLIILVAHQIFIMAGFDPLNIDVNSLYETISGIVTVVYSVYTSWKNNPVTDEAEQTEKLLRVKKEKKKKEKLEEKINGKDR